MYKLPIQIAKMRVFHGVFPSTLTHQAQLWIRLVP